MTEDVYTPYEAGLRALLARLGSGHARYTEALTYQQRLTENVAAARRYGDTETRRAERSEIVDRLNALAMEALGVSYSALSSLRRGHSDGAPSSLRRGHSDGAPSSLQRGHSDGTPLSLQRGHSDGTLCRPDDAPASTARSEPSTEGVPSALPTAPAGRAIPPPLEPSEAESLRRQLTEARENLRLIEERRSEYVMSTDVPLQLIKEERRLQERIAKLERRLGPGPEGE